MYFLFRVFRKIVYIILHFPRKRYYRTLQKRLINKTPTIIASDCLGSFIYHNLGLQFRTPTINLYIPKEDFWTFVGDLEEFLKAELVEIEDHSVPCPVGILKYDGKRVRIEFTHYKTFAEAKNKWDTRKQRVDLSNLYITQVISHATEEDINTFDRLPYPNKLLVTAENVTNSKNVYPHPVFFKKNYRAGEILEYRTIFSLKRHMDEIDYVGFLNRSHPKM